MTSSPKSSLLVILVRADRRQWFVAGVDGDTTVIPLVRSEPDNLDQYEGKSADEQLSFLRHRLSGAMQRGCDRLFGRDRKASRIVISFDDDLPDSADKLLDNLAEHLHTWMTRPTVSVYRCPGSENHAQFDLWTVLVGPPDEPEREVLRLAMPAMARAMDQDEWEVIAKPRA